ncbi:MAG: biotin/lipoyl-binding protein [Flavobacteriales bacterium]|nr:biotin/lipoyl-binding protein [Flavobacteriales bacterium]MCB9192850.1 biotin/lipoyl-binding protein [Flavobacteriales bacterium]
MSTQVKVSNKEFEVIFETESKTSGTINGKAFNLDISQLGPNIYHVIKDNRSYRLEVLEPADGKARLKVNGTIYEAETVDKFDALLKSLGMEKGGVSKVNELKAPMPGLVLDVHVNPGDAIKKGDKILVLEAMKMENVIKAPADATVASVEVQKGQTVDKNQVMVRFA